MEKLSYKTLEEQGYEGYLLKEAPERVLQFGEGNFLRAFADYFIDVMNEKAGFNGKVVLVQPRGHKKAAGSEPARPSGADRLNAQDCLYTLYLRGRENGEKVNHKRVISCASRCLNPMEDFGEMLRCMHNPDLRFIISNTTEAGIAFDPSCRADDAPPASFPGKLTRLLHERYEQKLPGFIILACELIDHNGDELKKCVEQYIDLWGLGEDFRAWVCGENLFCSTLVDRIVTGYPRAEAEALWEELGYRDDNLNTGEVFGLWVIEGPQSIKEELPFEKAGLPILVVDDHSPYKQRKVRILNGAHTSMVLAAYLAGQDIVRKCMEDPDIRGFMDKALYEEIIPTLDLPKEELMDFAAAVSQRFNNPYIDHALLDISLNSSSKWKARVMPSLTEYVKRQGSLPRCLTFSFAAYIAFYHNGREKGEGCLVGRRGNDSYPIRDDQWVLDFYYEHKDDSAKAIAHAVIHNEKLWGDTLARLPGFEEAVARDLERIEEIGMAAAVREVLA